MCGIAGIIDKNESVVADQKSLIKKMLDELVHRGPDHEGIWIGDKIWLGHRRLSIIDLTELANQPMTNQDESIVVVYNGEIYNHKKLRNELEEKGYIFQSNCDTEVLVHGYSLWKEDLLQKIDGFFSFAIWDANEQLLFCACDFFGKKPFYYSFKNGRFVFSSEMKSLVQGLPKMPEIAEELLGYYLLRGHFPPASSVFQDVKVLPAGHFLKYNITIGSFEIIEYRRKEFRFATDQIDGSMNWPDILEQTQARFQNAVTKRLESDVPLGALLSGGVDSSLVVLEAGANQSHPISTYTVTFKEKEYNEEAYAREIASKAGTHANFISVGDEDLFNLLPKLVDAYSEPFADHSAIPTYMVFKSLKSYLRVVLTGDGGDEMFGGYVDLKPFVWRNNYIPDFMPSFSFLKKLVPKEGLYSTSRPLRLLSYFMLFLSARADEFYYGLLRDGWTDYWRKIALRDGMWNLTGNSFPEDQTMKEFQKSGSDEFEQVMNMLLIRLTQDFLVKVDRASMANSIEVRCPFLDFELFSWVSSLNMHVLIRNGVLKAIPKAILDKKMKKDFSMRKKMGFTSPLSIWLRDRKKLDRLHQLLLDEKGIVQKLFQPEKIKMILDQHMSGKLNHTTRIWSLLFLNEWYFQMILGRRGMTEHAK